MRKLRAVLASASQPPSVVTNITDAKSKPTTLLVGDSRLRDVHLEATASGNPIRTRVKSVDRGRRQNKCHRRNHHRGRRSGDEGRRERGPHQRRGGETAPEGKVRDAVREDQQYPPFEEHCELRTVERSQHESEIDVCRP